MNTITLSDGSKQHTLDGWIGIQAKGDTMVKTKWRRTDVEYYEVNGYEITRNQYGRLQCQCKGYYFRKKCKHIKEINETN